MLVLSRKKNESIVIGEGSDSVVVYVIEIGSDKVRIGIDAPNRIPVDRLEMRMKKDRKRLKDTGHEVDTEVGKDAAGKKAGI